MDLETYFSDATKKVCAAFGSTFLCWEPVSREVGRSGATLPVFTLSSCPVREEAQSIRFISDDLRLPVLSCGSPQSQNVTCLLKQLHRSGDEGFGDPMGPNSPWHLPQDAQIMWTSHLFHLCCNIDDCSILHVLRMNQFVFSSWHVIFLCSIILKSLVIFYIFHHFRPN